MLFWLILQPGSMTFIAVRVGIAFVSMIFVYFSITWYEKNGWKSVALVLAVIIGFGSLMNFAVSFGFAHYPRITLLTMVTTAILILLYIKFIEPKVLNRMVNKVKETDLYIKFTKKPTVDKKQKTVAEKIIEEEKIHSN